MNGLSPTINTEQVKLREDLQSNNKACLAVKDAVQSIVLAAINSRKSNADSDDESTLPSENDITVIDCSMEDDHKSLESIEAISTDDERDQSDEEVEDIPGLKKLLQLMSNGEIQMPDEVLKQLNKLSTKIQALTELSNEMQLRYDELNNSVKEQKKENDRIHQYIMLDNLLLHKFPKPPNNLSSLQFSLYIAHQINCFLPYLPVPVHWSHISDAHPLRTKSNKSNVTIVRFCNRNIRQMIYDNRFHLTKRGLAITEHLIESNLDILKKAKELFGFHNVCTEKCNVIVDVDGKSRKMNTILDVYELFESINAQPHDSTYSSSNTSPPITSSNPITNKHTNSSQPPFQSYPRNDISNRNTRYSDTGTNESRNYNKFTSNRGRGRGHSGRRSGYSVYNRSY